MKKTLSVVLIVLSTLYILNPTAGVFELLPDNIPFVGNIDELFAFYVLFASFQYYRTGDVNVFKKVIRK